MKENSVRFRLAYSSPNLDSTMCCALGPSGECPLTKDILTSQEQLCNRPEVQEILELFRNSQHKSISTHITSDQ